MRASASLGHDVLRELPVFRSFSSVIYVPLFVPTVVDTRSSQSCLLRIAPNCPSYAYPDATVGIGRDPTASSFPLLVRDDKAVNVLFREWDAYFASYPGDVTTFNEDLPIDSTILEIRSDDPIAHTRLRSIADVVCEGP